MITINLIKTLNIIRLTVEQIINNTPNKKNKKNIIINTASIAAFDGQIGQAAYAASKNSIIKMTLPIARECADYGIHVATIAPKLFKTPLIAKLPSSVKKKITKKIPFPQRLNKPVKFTQTATHIIENPMLNGCYIRLNGALRMPPQ